MITGQGAVMFVIFHADRRQSRPARVSAACFWCPTSGGVFFSEGDRDHTRWVVENLHRINQFHDANCRWRIS